MILSCPGAQRCKVLNLLSVMYSELLCFSFLSCWLSAFWVVGVLNILSSGYVHC